MNLPKWPRRKSTPTDPTGIIDIYEDKAGEFRFRVIALNGKLPGEEGYVSRGNAFAGSMALRRALERPIVRERGLDG